MRCVFQAYAQPLSTVHETSAVHRSALGALRHLTDLARDAGSRRLLCYHDAITPAIEFALFATHRLNVFEPPPVPPVLPEPASGAGSRPLVRYQGTSPWRLNAMWAPKAY